MESYRLLHFRGTRLEHWEALEATGFDDAMDQAFGLVSSLDVECAELWQGEKRLVTFKPRLGKLVR